MRKARNPARPWLEQLESRRLLDATPFARISHTGTLLVQGTAGSDQMLISLEGAQIVVSLNGSQLGFPATEVSRLYFDAGADNDTVTDTADLSDRLFSGTLLGSAGNDTIIGANAEEQNVNFGYRIDGGDGNDNLAGGSGFNSIYGGAGNDTIVSGVGGNLLLGGDGNDTISTAEGDVISGDTIDGGAGDDVIFSNGGDSTITCGAGNDMLDYANAPVSSDGSGISVLLDLTLLDAGGSSSATVGNTPGSREVLVDLPETIAGTEFPDSFDLYYTVDSVTFFGRGGDDVFNNRAADFLNRVAGVHELGGAGNDRFLNVGSGFPEAINGGGGNDEFDPDPNFTTGANLVLNGGPGRDWLNLHDARSAVYDLNALTSIENVLNAKGGDTMIGNDRDNYIARADDGSTGSATLLANGGNDTLIGGAGDDYLSAGTGDDLIEGGGGADTIFGSGGNDLLAGNSGNDKIHGGLGNDTIVGQTGRDRLYGDDGDDLLLALDHQRDTVYGGNGTDSAYVDNSAKVKDLWDQIEQIR